MPETLISPFSTVNVPPEPGVMAQPSVNRSNKRRGADKREELSTLGLTRAFDEACASKPTAELVVLHLIGHYKFDLNELLSKIQARGLDVCFSKVTYLSIAPLVGLDPHGCLRDAPTFEIQRARIPAALFKEIIGDMQVALKQYGPPQDHKTEEARSRFLAPLMNRLVAQFNLLITNSPECIMPRRVTTKGRIEYQFKVCGALTILFIEIKLEVGTATERLNAVAQVIAEADACDFMNSKVNVSFPIYAILCDGKSFEFFTFDGRTRPPIFSRGIINNSRPSTTLSVPPFENYTPTAYIKALRPICECMHAIFLRGYIAGLQAYHDRSQAKAAEEREARGSTPACLMALGLAKDALNKALIAAQMADTGDMAGANGLVAEALVALEESVGAAPQTYRRDDCDLLSGWNEECE